MFGFLGFILIFILLIVFVVIALLGNLVRAIFGFGKRTPKPFQGEPHQTSQQQATSSSNSTKKKIFAEDEGEYVEYEEVN
jgi:hypothetical protein